MKGVAVFYCDTESELENDYIELKHNPDFSDLGVFDSIQSIYEELNYQGLSDDEIDQLTHNRYGNCLEILEHASTYYAFIGAR